MEALDSSPVEVPSVGSVASSGGESRLASATINYLIRSTENAKRLLFYLLVARRICSGRRSDL